MNEELGLDKLLTAINGNIGFVFCHGDMDEIRKTVTENKVSRTHGRDSTELHILGLEELCSASNMLDVRTWPWIASSETPSHGFYKAACAPDRG